MLGLLDFDRPAGFNGLVDVLHQVLEGFALGCASRNGRNFGLVAAFLRLVNNHLELHVHAPAAMV